MKRFLACLALCASLTAFAQVDCELFNIQEIAAELQNTTLDTAIVQTDGSVQVQLSNGNAFQLIFGCTDSDYTEYEASANTDDGSCITSVVEGCTDPAYTEYSASTNTDDGSCLTPVVYGCTNPAFEEYDPAANTDDGSCNNGCAPITMDGYTYNVVQVGDQCWFAENLRTTVYQNGDVIPAGLSISDWVSTFSGASAVYGEGNSYCHDGNVTVDICNETYTLNEYGRLYNWYAVTDERGVCPFGWFTPTIDDWDTLENFTSSSGFQGQEAYALKSSTGWDYNIGGNDHNGSDFFGLALLPSGVRGGNGGQFLFAGLYGFIWTSSSHDESLAKYISVGSGDGLFVSEQPKRAGYAVRCFRNID